MTENPDYSNNKGSKALSQDDYRAAEERFFRIAPRPLRAPGESLPTREELHRSLRVAESKGEGEN